MLMSPESGTNKPLTVYGTITVDNPTMTDGVGWPDNHNSVTTQSHTLSDSID